MRQERTIQASIFDLFAGHEIGRELKAMSQWLDNHPALVGLAARDLRRHGVKGTGREGLPTESVLRCGLLKQHRQLSYEALAFHLEAPPRSGPSRGCRSRISPRSSRRPKPGASRKHGERRGRC